VTFALRLCWADRAMGHQHNVWHCMHEVTGITYLFTGTEVATEFKTHK
jgi:hypothetical protein